MLTLKILFWVCLLIVFYTYLGYGILLYIIIYYDTHDLRL